MAGYGDLAMGITDGYLKGQDLKRRDTADAVAAEDRAMGIARQDRQDSQAAQDRQFTLEQRDRALKQQAFEDSHKNLRRQVGAALAQGNKVAAADLIEKTFNTDPTLNDGPLGKVESRLTRDANGNVVTDKGGNFSLTFIDRETGQPMGNPNSLVKPDDYILQMMNVDPMAAHEAQVAADAEESKRQKVRKEKIADYGTTLSMQNSARVTLEETLQKKGLGGGASRPTAFERMAEYWRNADPENRTQAQAADWARTATQMPYEKQLMELTKLIADTEGGAPEEIRARAAKILANEGISPNGRAAPAGLSVDGVATEFGF